MIRIAAVILLAVLLLGLPGCLVAAAGAGAATYAYVSGSLKGDLDASVKNAAAATKKAFDDMGIKLEEEAVSDLEAVIRGDSGGTGVKVSIDRKTDNTCLAYIRVGTWGDEKKSIAILDKIKANLK